MEKKGRGGNRRLFGFRTCFHAQPFSIFPSDKFFACGGLIHGQESLHEIAFAANGHAGKSFELAALRDRGSSIQPDGQQFQLIGWNAAEPDTVKQMFKHRGRKIGAANLRYQAWPLAP
jgi:hypothetical protein